MPKVGDVVLVGDLIGIIVKTDDRTIPTICHIQCILEGGRLRDFWLTPDDFSEI